MFFYKIEGEVPNTATEEDNRKARKLEAHKIAIRTTEFNSRTGDTYCFVSLISALKETNKMHNTIIKSTGHFFSSNAAQILTILLGVIIFGISPVTAAAFLLIGVLSSLAYTGLALDNVAQPLNEKKSLKLLLIILLVRCVHYSPERNLYIIILKNLKSQEK